MKKPTGRARHQPYRPPALRAGKTAPKSMPVALSGGLAARLAEAMARADRLMNEKRPALAVAAYDEVLALAPNHGDALVNRGVALRRAGRRDEALASYLRALAVVPDRAGVWVNAANALADANRLSEARAALDVTMRRDPMLAEAWVALSNLLIRRGREPAAEPCLRRAAALTPKDAGPLIRLAGLLAQRGMLDEALAMFDRARELGPLSAAAHSGYAQTLISQGRLDDAERHLRRALALDADSLDAHLGLARLLLLKGDLETGWVEYEWRRRKAESKLPKLPGREWDGSPIAGKTLLIYSEQGFGDVLQFARYIPLLAAKGARIIFAVPPTLRRLLEGLQGAAQLITTYRPMPTYDFHLPLLSVPKYTGISLRSVPAPVPYLKAPPASTPLPAPLGTRLKVGIVWAGSPQHSNDRNRSLSLGDMLVLAAVPGVALYSLQAGPRVGDIAKVAHPALVRDLSSYLNDFADTAAVVSQLDLVVCADTSVAHLAAALGRPVWVMTPFSPDWRWLIAREDTPWYPSMRLFRQSVPGRWDDVVEHVIEELGKLASGRAELGSAGESTVHSVFTKDDGEPRFTITIPRAQLADPAIRSLVNQERSGAGYDFAARCFVDAHLQPGDLFIDIGAHGGVMPLQAVTRWPGQVKSLVFDAPSHNLVNLRRWIEANRLGDAVELVGPIGPVGAGQAARTVDGALAERPALSDRRAIVRIDAGQGESDAVAGMARLLASGRVAAVICRSGGNRDQSGAPASLDVLRRRFAELGFSAWRFKEATSPAVLETFVEDGRSTTVFELAPGIDPLPSYNAPRLPADRQPPDPVLDAAAQAGKQLAAGTEFQSAGKIDQALAAFAEAQSLDQRSPELYNNLGVALRGIGRYAAAEAAYRRSVALAPNNPGNLSNLANLVRERGRLSEAEALHRKALALKPDDPRLIYNAALVPRDDHRAAEAQRMFEQTLALEPDNSECRWDLALIRLQQGDYARGFAEYETRWGLKRSPPRKVGLARWTGEPLGGRSVFLHDEQGFGDVLMFARFVPELIKRGAGRVILECQPELMRLMALTPGVDAVVRRGTPAPPCDVYAPLLSLPGLFGTTLDSLPRRVPYLNAPEPELTPPTEGRLKLGLAWAGKPTPRDRSIPIQELLPILGDPRFAAWSFQTGPRAADLKANGADAFVVDLGPRLVDFAETAALLKRLDLLVTIDTAVAHLAGALGVPAFVLLLYTSDWRWFDEGAQSPWYPSLRLFRQRRPNDWNEPLAELKAAMDAFAAKHRPARDDKRR